MTENLFRKMEKDFVWQEDNICLKDTHWEKAPSNKTPALTKSTNMGI